MIEHTAHIDALGRIRLPNKDQVTGLWVVKYFKNDKWNEEKFQDISESWSFYYRMFNILKSEFLEQLKQRNSK